jgi:hypothetical protein
MTKPIDTLLQKEMSRQEFLMTLGFGLASILGFSTLIHLLTGKSFESRLHRTSELGYGASPYGGGKE